MKRRKKNSPKTKPARVHLVPRADEDAVTITKVGAQNRQLGDFYVRWMAATWRRFLLLFVSSFLLINLIFASVYYVIGGIENTDPDSFTDAFFFSVQTLSTVGYGHWSPISLAANITVAIEAMVGILFAAVATGIIFSKFSRPTARVIFSNVAVINSFNGTPHLMFRVANQRNNRIVDARIHVALLRKETSSEGHRMRIFHDMELVRRQMPLLQLSWTVMHPLDKNSPLYGVNAEKLKEWDGEILVSLSGIDETFSQTVHARHSYLPDDIVPDAVFVDVVTRHEEDNGVEVNLARFHDTAPHQKS
jgi:inward rectifier potassium channel